jgi:hypothetical protein
LDRLARIAILHALEAAGVRSSTRTAAVPVCVFESP